MDQEKNVLKHLFLLKKLHIKSYINQSDDKKQYLAYHFILPTIFAKCYKQPLGVTVIGTWQEFINCCAMTTKYYLSQTTRSFIKCSRANALMENSYQLHELPWICLWKLQQIRTVVISLLTITGVLHCHNHKSRWFSRLCGEIQDLQRCKLFYSEHIKLINKQILFNSNQINETTLWRKTTASQQ